MVRFLLFIVVTIISIAVLKATTMLTAVPVVIISIAIGLLVAFIDKLFVDVVEAITD
jgi:predicted membrane chloride channel (bestrophin family)